MWFHCPMVTKFLLSFFAGNDCDVVDDVQGPADVLDPECDLMLANGQRLHHEEEAVGHYWVDTARREIDTPCLQGIAFRALTVRFFRYEFFTAISRFLKVNRSQPVTSTRVPSARVSR